MSNDLYRLIYYSQNRMADNTSDIAAEISTILADSQANNEKVGVTGALLFNSGCFVQVLEGPLAAVEEVFEFIQQDERHGDVSLLGFDPVTSRSFDNWSMGFVGTSPGEATRHGPTDLQSGFDPAQMTGEALFEMMLQLALEQERAAA